MNNRKIVGIMLIAALFLGTATISMGNAGNDIQIALSPLTASNPVGTTHTVIATVTINGVPLQNQTVVFSIVSGPNFPLNGTGLTNASGQATFTYSDSGGAGTDTIIASIDIRNQAPITIFSNEVTKEWIFPTVTQGFMTGGGSIFDKDGTRITHGFELQCDKTKSPNNLEVNWNGNKFHLEELTAVRCYDDPSIEPNPPKAGFDTYKGIGIGRYNGVDGAKAIWTFTDAGEPGIDDTATIFIRDAGGNVVLSVSGKLDKGNQQAHK